MESDAFGFHYHIVVDSFGAANHRLDLFDRSAKRDREFIVIGVKTLIAQRLQHRLRLLLIGTFVVNLLVEHHTDSCLLFCSGSQFSFVKDQRN
jgi:hypothetical protein